MRLWPAQGPAAINCGLGALPTRQESLRNSTSLRVLSRLRRPLTCLASRTNAPKYLSSVKGRARSAI